MFSELFNLFNKFKTSNITPKEDFNTEIFAGILNSFPELKNEFTNDFIGLKEDNYTIKTQYFCELEDDINCFIDLALIGEYNICFIESKVDSGEGVTQLERYAKALAKYFPNHHKTLVYCTKNYDKKKCAKTMCSSYDTDFIQIRWYEVAKMLESFKETNAIVNSYLIFLNNLKMSDDNTLRAENLISMENLNKTIELLELYVRNSRPSFQKIFNDQSNNNIFNISQLRSHNRVSFWKENIAKTESKKWSEMLYCVYLGDLKLICQIYIHFDHEYYEKVKSIEVDSSFVTDTTQYGYSIRKEQDLGMFLNNTNSEELIKKWFSDRFQEFKELIDNNPSIPWNV